MMSPFVADVLAVILCPNDEIFQNTGADANMGLSDIGVTVYPAKLSIFANLFRLCQ